MANMESLQDKIKALPASPGCYIFYNAAGEIIYIGKSKALKHRVRQYFQHKEGLKGKAGETRVAGFSILHGKKLVQEMISSNAERKYQHLAAEVVDLKVILTPTERDALILECQMVKQHQPRYNAQLKRTKKYPYLRIDSNVEYPVIQIVGKNHQSDGDCFGFFYNEDEAYETIKLINRIWQTPLCGKPGFSKDSNSCLNYHIKRCCAPCHKQISPTAYDAKIREIRRCLNGQATPVFDRLNRQMKQAAGQMDYEKAAIIRDTIRDLELLQMKCRRLNTFFDKQEVYLFYRAYREKGFTLFYIYGGAVLNRIDFENSKDLTIDHFKEFVEQIYAPEFDRLVNEEKQFLTRCLVDVYADKYYVPLNLRQSKKSLPELLHNEYRVFIGK